MSKKVKEANARENSEIKRRDKVPIVAAVIFVICLLTSVILGIVLAIDYNELLIFSIFILAIVAVIYLIKFLAKEKPVGKGYIPAILKYRKKADKDNEDVLVNLKMIYFSWIFTVLFGGGAIIIYPFWGDQIFYKMVTLIALFSWVLWNLVNIGYIKPLNSEPIKEFGKATKYLFFTEIPTMLSLGSIIISIFVYGDEVTFWVLYIFTLLIALMIVSLTVIFERG